jgi:hypothetical protein
LEVVRYSLKLAEDEQLVEIDVRDAESVKHLLQQLRLPLPHSESNGQTAAGAAAQPQTAFR